MELLMTRAFTWKHLSIAVAVLLMVGLCCLALGNTNAATALFVVAIAEGVFGAAYVSLKRRA
jgi:4-hydroxybenzoate polyprenyltransferase